MNVLTQLVAHCAAGGRSITNSGETSNGGGI